MAICGEIHMYDMPWTVGLSLRKLSGRICYRPHGGSLRDPQRCANPRNQHVRIPASKLNIAKTTEPLESPSMADFIGNLDRIHSLAEQPPAN